MKIGSFEFNLRELAGSTGDFSMLLPLAIGYIAVCGLNPAGFLAMMGLANIGTGLVYRLPMPIQPMKVLAVVAIMLIKGEIRQVGSPGFYLPPVTGFQPVEVWRSLLSAGFAQVPLTAINAVIATSLLLKTYWPDRPVDEGKLSFNMGIMNLIVPLSNRF